MPPAKDGLALVLRVRNWLRVMKTNLLYAKTFVQEISFDEFLSNIEKQYSTARAIEVAGEVSKKFLELYGVSILPCPGGKLQGCETF